MLQFLVDKGEAAGAQVSVASRVVVAAHAERLETGKSFQTPAEGSDHSRGLKEELLIHGGTPGNAARCCCCRDGGGGVV